MRKMGIGLGVGINRSNYAQGIFNAYSARVVADGGVVESGSCVDAVSSLLQSASLLLIPSGYKGGKLYAEIPTNGNGDLTWTRGSDAFRTNASGVLQRVPWNLASYSDDFSNATYSKYQATITTNATTSPDGTLTADKIIPTAVAAEHYALQNINTNAGTPYTYSVYLKASEYTWAKIGTNVPGSAVGAFFNLSTGVVGTTDAGVTASIVNVGNGWYRCIITTTSNSTALKYFVVWPTNSGTAIVYTGDGTSGIFAYGFQVVEGTTAQTYLPTTDRLNFPRISYMYGSCPAALLEPQRTNLFFNSGWTGGGATPTSWTSFITGSTTAVASIKNNSVTAYRFSGSTQRAFFVYATSVTSGTTYAVSAYVESVTTTGDVSFMLSFANMTGTATYYRNGVLITASTTIEAGYTYTMLFVPSANASGEFRIGMGAQGNATANYVLSMPQYEQGAYATTFILTPTSATATRVADSFSRNNIYTNGLISASGGTWFVSFVNNAEYIKDSGDRGLFLDTSNTGNTNGFQFVHRNTGGITQRILINKRVSGADTIIYQSSVETIKLAIKWNGTSADVFANGTKVVTATSFTTTAMEFLNFTSDGVPFFIQQMALFPTPLTDTQCQTLTT